MGNGEAARIVGGLDPHIYLKLLDTGQKSLQSI